MDSLAGKSQITDCAAAAGYYGSPPSPAKPCPAGYFCPAAEPQVSEYAAETTNKKECPKHHYCVALSSSAVACKAGTMATKLSVAEISCYVPILGRGYASLNNRMYYNGAKFSPSITPASFQEQEMGYATANLGHSFFQGVLVADLSAYAFAYIDGGYARDDTDVFFRGVKLDKPSDGTGIISNFEYLGSDQLGDDVYASWAKWGRTIYYQAEIQGSTAGTSTTGTGTTVTLANGRLVSALYSLSSFYGSDATCEKCECRGTNRPGGIAFRPCSDLPTGFIKEDSQCASCSTTQCCKLSCQSSSPCIWIDNGSGALERPSAKKDYYKLCNGADAKCEPIRLEDDTLVNHVTHHGGEYADDSHKCWYRHQLLTGCRPISLGGHFQYLGGGFAGDQGRVWYRGINLRDLVLSNFAGGGTSNFVIIGTSELDPNTPVIPGVDGVSPGWLSPSGGAYATWGSGSTASHFYASPLDGVVLMDAFTSSTSLHLVHLGGGYATDQSKVFYNGEVLSGVSTAHFRYCACGGDYAIYYDQMYFRGVRRVDLNAGLASQGTTFQYQGQTC
jgi:hypothetical protein